MKDYKNLKAEATDVAYPCKRGNMLPPYSLNHRAVKNCKNPKAKAIDAVWTCKRGNLSPSVLTESEQSDA